MRADALLERLDNVRQYGDSWRANCPNGHSKAVGSLSITEAEDGRVLLHCFACGDTAGILRALGLDMAALFPERLKDLSPEGRRAAADAFKRNGWRAALGVLDREATVVLIAANDVHDGKVLSADDQARLGVAVERIAKVREVFHGRT